MTNSIWEKDDNLAQKFWTQGAVADCPVYDMHGHMGEHNAIYFARCQPEAMVSHFRRAGVRRLAFSHHWCLIDGLGFGNEQAYQLATRFPEFLRLYLAINPHHPDIIKQDLLAFEDWRPLALGLKFLPDYHRVAVSDPAYADALRFADTHHLPVLVHTWGGSQYNGAEIMARVAPAYPNAIFFMGHSFSGDLEGAQRVQEASPDNCYFELTSLPGQNNVIEQLVAKLGSERLLFGTDLPWFDEFQAIGGILGARISEEAQRDILYRNVEKLLGRDW